MKLQDIQEEYKEKYSAQDEWNKQHEIYLNERIFYSHEDALNYCVEHPNERIQWYGNMLHWDSNENAFVSNDPLYWLDGIAIYKANREDLLIHVFQKQKRIKAQFPYAECPQLTANGTLDLVHINL